MDDVLTNATKIHQKIDEIGVLADNIEDAADNKALKLSNYERVLALTIVKLRNGLITSIKDVDDKPIEIKSLPANLVEKVARGIVYVELLEKEASDSGYKGLLAQIDALKAQLNGLQSVNRRME
nr:hypothetical protein [uncultured Draconibacterium sp.]